MCNLVSWILQFRYVELIADLKDHLILKYSQLWSTILDILLDCFGYSSDSINNIEVSNISQVVCF